jgi:hypothetical protein
MKMGPLIYTVSFFFTICFYLIQLIWFSEQVLINFLWYDQLHPFLFSNPTFGAKIFTSKPGVNHVADFYGLIGPRGGAGSSSHQHVSPPPGTQIPPAPPSHPTPPTPSQLTPPPPLQHPSTGGGPIDDNNDNAFNAPLGNALDLLDGDFEMHDGDDVDGLLPASRLQP